MSMREGGNFGDEKGPAADVPGHVRRSTYLKRLSRGQHRYGADAGWGVRSPHT